MFAKETSKTFQQTTLQTTFVVLGALWVKIRRTIEQNIPIHLIILMHLSVEPSTETAEFATYGVRSGTIRLGLPPMECGQGQFTWALTESAMISLQKQNDKSMRSKSGEEFIILP